MDSIHLCLRCFFGSHFTSFAAAFFGSRNFGRKLIPNLKTEGTIQQELHVGCHPSSRCHPSKLNGAIGCSTQVMQRLQSIESIGSSKTYDGNPRDGYKREFQNLHL